MATSGKINVLERLSLDSVEHYLERTNQACIGRLSTEILDYTDGSFGLFRDPTHPISRDINEIAKLIHWTLSSKLILRTNTSVAISTKSKSTEWKIPATIPEICMGYESH
jgi:hypothetical protein